MASPAFINGTSSVSGILPILYDLKHWKVSIAHYKSLIGIAVRPETKVYGFDSVEVRG